MNWRAAVTYSVFVVAASCSGDKGTAPSCDELRSLSADVEGRLQDLAGSAAWEDIKAATGLRDQLQNIQIELTRQDC